MWIDSQKVFQRWSDFVSQFVTDFPSIESSADIHIEMMNSGVNKDESVIEYYYRMLSLGRRGGLDDNSIIKYVVNGLSDVHLRRTLIAINFSSCTDLFKTLNKINEENKTRSYQNEQPRKSNFRKMDNFKSDEKAPNNENSNAVKTGPLCFNCRERGHIARNCHLKFKKLKCNKCNSKDHETDKSPSQSVNLIDENNESIPDKEIFKEIEIDNKKFNALIDSGSGRSLMSKRVSLEINGLIENCKNTLHGFGGGEYICNLKMTTTVKIDDSVLQEEFLIVDNDVMQYDVLIGRDILSKRRVIMENGQ